MRNTTFDSVALPCRSRLAAASVSIPHIVGLESEKQSNMIPILCSIFLANQGTSEDAGEEKSLSWVRNLLYYLLFETSSDMFMAKWKGGSRIHAILLCYDSIK